MFDSNPTVSVVVPCFNEEAGLLECHRQLTTVLDSLGEAYEIVYVDDGSRDNTLLLLEHLQESDRNVTVVELSRNFGHQIAVSAGLENASGQAVVIIDADLQDPPALIAEMLKIWRQGYDVVYGVRAKREGESHFKLWTAKGFYRCLNALSDVQIPLDTGDFRLLDRKAVQAMLRMTERHRLLRGMSSWIGFRQYPLEYDRAARFAGETKYPLRKMLLLALDGIISFSVVPLRILVGTGFGAAVLSMLGILYCLGVRLFTESYVSGWATLFIALLFMGGLQLMGLGIVGEYIGRIYTEVKQRPLYFTRTVKKRRGNAYLDYSTSVAASTEVGAHV